VAAPRAGKLDGSPVGVMYKSREHTVAAIAATVGVSRATLYRSLAPAAVPEPVAAPPDPVAAVAKSPSGVPTARAEATVKPHAPISERPAAPTTSASTIFVRRMSVGS